MVDTVTIRVSGSLRRYIEQRAGKDGMYESASEYIRDLIRRDFEREEQRKWAWLTKELESGMMASESDFVPFDVESIIRDAKAEYGA